MTTTPAVAYLRVSTTEQAVEGVSLAAQKRAIEAYCAFKGLGLVDVVIDAGVSAGKALASREGGERVLGLVRSGAVRAVVAFKLDRLFRDCADCLMVTRDWDAAGVALHLIDLGGQAIDTSSAMGRFFLTVMAGAAELERNQIRERTASALQHLKAEGVTLGGEALGWKRTDATDAAGRLVCADVDSECKTVERICGLRADGMSMRAIADVLTAEGHRTKRGGKWYASTVKAVLDRAVR